MLENGVLNKYTKYDETTIPDIKEGAKDFIEQLSKDAELYLFTTRNLLLASKWIIKYDLDIYFKDVTNIKIPCHLFIDDRAVCFKGSYAKTLDEIKNFKPYWKN